MRVVAFPETVAERGVIRIPRPFCRYVLPEGDSAGLVVAASARGIHPRSDSSFNPLERRFSLRAARPGDSVLFWRHGAYGDALVATGVVHALRRLAPEVRFDVWTDAQAVGLFSHAAERAYAGPIPLDSALAYRWHLLYDQAYEADSEPEQACCYDSMLAWAGADPDAVPDDWKRPRVEELDSDSRPAPLVADAVTTTSPVSRPIAQVVDGRRYVLAQVEPNNPVRAYPPELLAEALRSVIDRSPDVLVVTVGVGESPAPVRWGLPPGRHLDLVGATHSFRALVPLVRRAACVVCPDSSVGHLAAAFPGVPVVSLWGSFHPGDRARYYSNHRPLTAFEACPHAPCRPHRFSLPQEKCKDATNAVIGEQRACCALRAISPGRVADAVLEAINP